MPLGTIHRSGN